MIRRMYCIYDHKAESVVSGVVQVLGTDEEAKRMFRSVVAAQGTIVHEHPDDFGLHFLGEVDFDNLAILPTKSPHVPILLGGDVVREILRARNVDTSGTPAEGFIPPDLSIAK